MEFSTFPIVALGMALICLIGVTLYAITQRGSLRSRDEQLVVARAQAYAMLELSQAGVLFLDREHKLMGEASAAAPELLGHTCTAGTAFVQVIADLVHVNVRRETVAHLETLWTAEPASLVDATQNPLARVHSGARHLAIRFSRLVVDGRVHHIIVSIERISAPRLVPQTIEVPVLDEETFARGQISGCDIAYQTVVWGEPDDAGFDVRWQITGEALFRAGGTSSNLDEGVASLCT